MTYYQHILLAVDFFEQDKIVINKAKDLAEQNHARLSIIHVVDNIPLTDINYTGEIAMNFDLSNQLMELAKQRLHTLAQELAISAENVFLEIGSPKTQIVSTAQDNQVDLIVLGSHGRHGLALLLGSTANGVLHHATCDVLAVRLPEE